MAGFCELTIGLRAPELGSPGAKSPIVSCGYLKYSRFRETATGEVDFHFDLKSMATDRLPRPACGERVGIIANLTPFRGHELWQARGIRSRHYAVLCRQVCRP
jgi:hypothetical protein